MLRFGQITNQMDDNVKSTATRIGTFAAIGYGLGSLFKHLEKRKSEPARLDQETMDLLVRYAMQGEYPPKPKYTDDQDKNYDMTKDSSKDKSGSISNNSSKKE